MHAQIYSQKEVEDMLQSQIELPPDFTLWFSEPVRSVEDNHGMAETITKVKLFCGIKDAGKSFEIDLNDINLFPQWNISGGTASNPNWTTSKCGAVLLFNHLGRNIAFLIDGIKPWDSPIQRLLGMTISHMAYNYFDTMPLT